MAEIRCPMCGRPNPAELDTCVYCQARLKPVVPLPEPSSPASGSNPGSGNVADWLDALRAAQGIVTGQLTPPPSMPGSFTPQTNAADLGQPARDPDHPANTPPAPFESVSAVSDWLHRLDPPAAAKEEPDEEPDWLESIRRRSAADTAPGIAGRAEPQPAPAASDTDWLQSLRQAPPEAEPPAKPEEASTAGSGDDWLSRIGGAAPAVAPEPEIPTELPDWLKDAPQKPAVEPPGAGNPSFAGGAPTATPADETPEWLKFLPPFYPPPEPAPERIELPPSPPPPPLEPPSAEFAEFLKNAARMDEPPSGAGFQSPDQPTDQSEGEDLPGWSTGPTPDWLAALEAKAGTPPSLSIDMPSVPPLLEQTSDAPDTPDAGHPVGPFISSALPDWLGELGTAERSADQSTPPGVPLSEADNPDLIESAELPSWVQALRPVETVAPKSPIAPNAPSETRIEDSGPLAGLRGILPAEPTVIPATKPPAAATYLAISEVQQRHSQVLENLLASEGQAEEQPAAPAISSQRILRMAIATLILAALLVPLLGGIQLFPPPASAPAEVTALQSSIETLPANAPVLLVADFSPAVSGEIQAAASAPLTDLLVKGARLTVISTTATGPALADHLLSGLIPASDPQYAAYRNGDKLIHLGYLPGGTTSLAAFAADPRNAAPFTVDNRYAWELPGLQGVQALSDFVRVIVLTEDANTGQAWIEQVQPRLGNGAALLVIAGAQAAPSLRPYLDSHQVQGLVAGVAGGAAYEALIGRPGVGRVYWDAFQFGTWAAVLIILIGSLAVVARPALAAIRKGEGA